MLTQAAAGVTARFGFKLPRDFGVNTIHTTAVEVPDANGESPLSRRETEVLRLVAVGLSNREIASTLVLSEHTVHRHVANILRKLGEPTRAAAAARATRDGLV